MNTLVKVARYHLVNRIGFVILPLGVLAFVLAVCLIISAAIVTPVGGVHVGALASIFIIFFILGVQSVAQSLPFGLSLGLSRRWSPVWPLSTDCWSRCCKK
jgi:hypothetical protein